MNKFGTAALGMVFVCSAAQAEQSVVTVYGHFDVGLVKVSGASPILSRGLNNWLGFRGAEDLGGGLETIFNIQMRFYPDTGGMETGVLFQGESTVGLRSKQWGTMRIGRALTPFWAQKWRYDPWYDSQYMGSVGAWQNGSYNSDPSFALNYADYSRISNGVFYDSPSAGGFQLHVASELERRPGAPGRTASYAADYIKGPVDIGLSYERNWRDDDIRFAGASWALGAFTVMGTYGQVRLAGAPHHEDNYTAAATYAVGSADTLRLAFGTTRHAGGVEAAPATRKIATGYVHALSKRTTLFSDLYRETVAVRRYGVALGMTHTF
ncbi:porin [Massilia luteola]|uniref:porin n=1 Tax=Massilia luteola TaxID=3081751 RepID=UPI002ACBE465|nr:porin [Massilia sp. Gc5]